MSSHRMIKDSFWTDSYIANLDPVEKLLFLYLLTNPLCNIAGIYEIQDKRIAFDSGIDVEMVKKLLGRFVKDGKVLRHGDWLLIINHAKHQAYKNDNVYKGISRIIEELPSSVKALKGFERLSHLTLLNLTLPNAISAKGENKMGNWNKQGDDFLEDDIQIDPEHKPKTKKQTKKVSDDVQQVFDLFDNPAKAIWRLREIERESAKVLFDTYGIDTLKKRMERISKEKNNKDPLFPLVTTPSQLLDKMPNVERYFGI